MDKLAFSVLNKHLLTTKLCVTQAYFIDTKDTKTIGVDFFSR